MNPIIEYLKNGMPMWVYYATWSFIFTTYFAGIIWTLILGKTI